MQKFIISQQSLPLTYVAKGLEGSPAQLTAFFNAKGGLKSELQRCGAILFRGFKVYSEAIFESAISRVVPEKMAYVDGNSPRTSLGKGIYTSTEFPGEAFITLHNELSYAYKWPGKLYFCCTKVAEQGGETPLADSRKLLKSLPPTLVEKWQAKGLKYIRNLHSGSGLGVSWQQTFETDNPQQVEEILRQENASFEWTNEGLLHIEQFRDATKTHPETGETVWFNQADQFHATSLGTELYDAISLLYKGDETAFPQHCCHGDGSPIDTEDLKTIQDVTNQISIKVKWQRGDFLVVDNMLVSHGRMPFKGTRRVLVAMSQ